MKLGLHSTRLLLAALGNPERTYPVIHIAGTNGKGSTAAMLASACMESGLRTGLYTSPHLVRFTERIRINGREIPGDRLVGYVRLLHPLIENLRATFFEVVTAIAFRHFADEHVDIAVIETGLGGRLDSTNVVTPLVAVITSIGLDHRRELGSTLTAIAREKAGIIKPDSPCVTSASQPRVLSVIRRTAAARGARLFEARKIVAMDTGGRDAILTVRGRKIGKRRIVQGLAGAYQEENVRLVAAVWEILLRQHRLEGISGTSLAAGIRNVVRNTRLRGRYERTREGILFDVAHNPPAVEALAGALKKNGRRNLRVVFGVMKDKDHRRMLATLAPLTARFFPVRPRTGRALSSGDLRRSAVAAGMRPERGGTVEEGLRRALRARTQGAVLVTGSHYVVGEAMEVLSRISARKRRRPSPRRAGILTMARSLRIFT
jgi:dihydrofolate synthase / folylpolyglutamate synthase